MIAMLVISSANMPAQKGGPRGKVISAYSRADQGPGKMDLLAGYVAGLPEGSECIDTECGYIWNPQGLTIRYDIGGLAGPGLGPESSNEDCCWYGEANINGQTVRYAVSGEGKPDFIMVSFPASYANFNADVRSEAEVRTVLQMLLTYQGKGYEPDPKGVVDARVLSRHGTPVSGIQVFLQRSAPRDTQTARTDNKGHVRFLNVLPGRYELGIDSKVDCSLRRRWKMTMEPAEILLRSLTVQCR